MERQIIQLLLEREGRAHRDLHEYEELPAAIEPSALGLSDEGGALFRLERRGAAVFLVPSDGRELTVNGQAVSGPLPLKGGDRIACGGCRMRFYVRRPDTRLSFGSLFLVRLAIAVIVLFVIMELLLMLGFPRAMMARQAIWEKAKSREDMLLTLQLLRGRVHRFQAHSPFVHALLNEIAQDLENRAQFVQENELRMRNRSRRAMTSDLERISALLDKLERTPDYGQPKMPDVERALKTIIETNKE